jgi:hypothetical protein
MPNTRFRQFKLSHHSPGAGYVYARSSWDEDATYFFFKCGNRFTAHQHLDVGTFLIYKGGELVGDGGHYDGFGTPHDVNYHLRTIAHNTIRVIDPKESWEVKNRDPIRGGKVTANDGGQRHDFPHHNGAASDAAAWNANPKIWETGKILAFEDKGNHVFIKADCTKAYSAHKLESFVRQIIFLRPGTFIIVDAVRVKDVSFKTIWNLQAMKQPAKNADGLWTWGNGGGQIFLQTLLPEKSSVEFFSGENLYVIDGVNYPPQRDTGPAPECRVEVSPAEKKNDHLFVHVLTATADDAAQPPLANAVVSGSKVTVKFDSGQAFEFEVKYSHLIWH